MRHRLTAVFGLIAAIGTIAACGGGSSGGGSGTAAFMGGDGIVDDAFFQTAGTAGNGALGTIAAPNTATLGTAAKFVSDFGAKFGANAIGAYSANTYDAMNIVLTAAQEAIVANGGKLPDSASFRTAVIANIQSIVWKGAIGTTTFDQNGDTTNALLTLYKGSNQKWAFDASLTVHIPGQAMPNPNAPATTPVPGSQLSSCTGTVGVATDLPTSGSDATDGMPAEQGAELAVDQAQSAGMFGGCTLKYTADDDASVALGKHDPALGAQNITALVGDPTVVGVVGPFNSNVAQTEMPIANNGHLALISPSNTNPGLTIVGSNPDIDTNSLRPTGHVTYFRVCTTDLGQGKALADYAYNNLHLSKAYVIDDQETYGKGLADIFSKDFMTDGGTIAKRASLPGSTTDFRPEITDAQGLGVDLVFFGGTFSNGGAILRKQQVQAGFGTTS
ncbi:MAG: ABC transporter substrate-binding protein [Candidatus Dormibacteraeota bacterium]|nr:ABC transporter substrate-binding protein [Candidatus Dormibacteraeota bacterium]